MNNSQCREESRHERDHAPQATGFKLIVMMCELHIYQSFASSENDGWVGITSTLRAILVIQDMYLEALRRSITMNLRTAVGIDN